MTMHDTHEIAKLDPAAVERARTIAVSEAIGGRVKLVRKSGRLWGLCPFHNEKTPSFSVADAKGYAHCFGCGWHGDAIGFVMRDQNLSFKAAVEYLTGPQFKAARRIVPRAAVPHDRTWSDDDVQRSLAAYAIWSESERAYGTDVERYLRGRAIKLRVPPSLRHVPDLRHPSGHRGPAMVAAVQAADGRVIAIQRTWLLPGGAGRDKTLDPGKMSLGPMMDGAVRLAAAGRTLGLAEGIETALSAMQLFSLPCWSTLGTARLDQVWLPEQVERVVIFADQGEAGAKAAQKAVERYEQERREVLVETPEGDAKDFNDVLRAKAPGRAA